VREGTGGVLQKKVSMLGSYAVGKTSLVRQFVSSIFDEKYHTTIGVKVDKKVVSVEGQDLQLMLWDIAGAEDDFSIPTSFIRGSAAYLLVIDGTRAETLDRALDLAHMVHEELGAIPMAVALNKADLVDEWCLDESMIARLDSLCCPVFRSSAKTGEGVEEAFQALASQLV
jgi:small GTP-binding protein